MKKINQVDKDDVSMLINDGDHYIEVENSPSVETCQCGKPDKKVNFECQDCGKHFCVDCPTAPIDDNCLECMMLVESYPVTSTPTKRNL